MRAELYNDKWLESHSNNLKTKSRHIDLPSNEIDVSAFVLYTHSSIPTVAELNIDQDVSPLNFTPINPPSVNHESTPVHDSSMQSRDKLFFISYNPEGTMIHQWYLIGVSLVASEYSQPNFSTICLYYWILLAKHPGDENMSNEFSRWYLDWHRYFRDSASNDIISGDMIIFRPSISPDDTKYVQWYDVSQIVVNNNTLTIWLWTYIFNQQDTC